MDNRKITVVSYLGAAFILWFLSRSFIHFLYLSFYQIRRFPGVVYAREAIPFLLALILFGLLITNPKANLFFDEVINELRKVTWPSLDDVTKSTTVVLICVGIASVVLAVFDLAWGKLIGYLLHS
jgi:preprotein translocase SecE subunit